MIPKRWITLLATMVIGEGVIGMLDPRGDLMLWLGGPRPYRRIVEAAIEHPEAMRVVFAAQILAGFCLARGQLRSVPSEGVPDASRDSGRPSGGRGLPLRA